MPNARGLRGRMDASGIRQYIQKTNVFWSNGGIILACLNEHTPASGSTG
jgi:hypothetical protein